MAYPSPNPALDGESRQTEIIVILSVACTLSTLAVVLRCISRGVILRSFGMDDVVIVPAQILTIASAVAIGLETKYGLGRHAWTMPEEQYTPYMKSFYGSIIVYNIAVCLTKISILLQYQRIFNNTKLRKFIFVGLCFLICWGITLCFLLPLSCIPVAAFWDPDVKGFCLDNTTIWYVMAGVNVVTDFAVFTMPIPVISSLQLPTRQKAMLLIVFTLGVFPCAVSIYRIKTLASVNGSKDASWDNVDAATFSFLELSVGVIAVCLPTLRPILVHAMPRLFGSLLRSSNGRTGSNGPSGGHASRTPFGRSGRGGAESTARASLFKNGSTLRESESTEGLRDGVEGMTRSRIDRDIEFGELDSPGSPGYTVTVVAGWEPKSISELVDKSENRPGIKTTTVVTQKVTFAGEGSETGRRSGDKSSDDGR